MHYQKILQTEKKKCNPPSAVETLHLCFTFITSLSLSYCVFSFIHSQTRVNVYNNPSQISRNPPKSICSFDSASFHSSIEISLSLCLQPSHSHLHVTLLNKMALFRFSQCQVLLNTFCPFYNFKSFREYIVLSWSASKTKQFKYNLEMLSFS